MDELVWHHNNQHDDIQHNDSWHSKKYDTRHNILLTVVYAECRNWAHRADVVILSVVLPSVVAPLVLHRHLSLPIENWGQSHKTLVRRWQSSRISWSVCPCQKCSYWSTFGISCKFNYRKLMVLSSSPCLIKLVTFIYLLYIVTILINNINCK